MREAEGWRGVVYDGHLSPVVRADGYFDAIVPFRELLGLSSNP